MLYLHIFQIFPAAFEISGVAADKVVGDIDGICIDKQDAGSNLIFIAVSSNFIVEKIGVPVECVVNSAALTVATVIMLF